MVPKDPNPGNGPRPGGSWRGGKAKAAAANAPRRWQDKPQQRELDARIFRRRARLASVWGLAAVLIGVFVYTVFKFDESPPLFTLAITAYEAPLPPNGWAREDCQQLSQLAANVRPYPIAESQWQTKDEFLLELKKQLSKVSRRRSRGSQNVVLVYLSAHGVVNGVGQPCLLLANNAAEPAQVLKTDRWLPVSDLVKALNVALPGTKKVLFLDANRMSSNWSIGLLYNAFAEGLQAAIDLNDQREVAIVNSTGPGQIGCVSSRDQETAFGHFVRAGLSGLDRAAGDDQWLTLKEFSVYLKTKVKEWALKKQFDVQEPILVMPQGMQDFTLAYVDETPLRARARQDSDTEGAARKKLGELWTVHERQQPWPDNSAPQLPRERLQQWHRFGANLVCAEQMLSAGSAYRGIFPNVMSRLETTAKELEEGGLRSEAVVPSLALMQDRPRLISLQQKAWTSALANPTRDGIAAARGQLQSTSPDGPEPIELHWLGLLDTAGNLPEQAWSGNSDRIAEALQARKLAEEAAAPGDERAHYAAYKLVIAADDNRRHADDALFVSREASDRAQPARIESNEQYQTAQQQATALADAFRSRDRAWGQLPFLAQWFARRTNPDEDNDETIQKLDLQVRETVKLAQQSQELAKGLDEVVGATLGDTDTAPTLTAVKALESLCVGIDAGLNELLKDVNTHVTEVLGQANDQKTMREIEDLLATPLVTGDDRNSLVTIHAQLNVNDATAPERADRSADPAIYLNRTQRWGQHPAVALLDDKSVSSIEDPAKASAAQSDAAPTKRSPGQIIGQLSADGQMVRDALFTANESVSTLLHAEIVASATIPAAADVRADFSRADQIARRVAPLSGGVDYVQANPVARLFQFDWTHLLLFYASRTLDDFYGPTPKIPNAQPYFAQAWAGYQRAWTMLGDKQPALKPSIDRQQRDLTTLASAAAAGILAKPEKQNAEADAAEYVRDFQVAMPKGLPQGEIALYVTRDNAAVPIKARGKNEELSGERISLPSQQDRSEPFQIAFSTGNTATTENVAVGKFGIKTFFRGEIKWTPFDVRPRGPGIELVSDRQNWDSSQITVSGGAEKRGTIVFVLDCSGSMAFNQEKRLTYEKMDSAKATLREILSRLAKIGRYEVGLWIYGHRIGFETDGTRRWNDAWGPNVAALQPGDDVQSVVPIQPLTNQSLNTFITMIDDKKKVRPFGQTPLYRAISDVVTQDLSRVSSQTPRRLIVITDGKNDVTGSDRATPSTVVDVFTANPGIKLDIIGVQMAAEPALDAMVNNPAVRGVYYGVNKLDTLTQRLVESLGLYQYSVTRVPPNDRTPTLPVRDLQQTTTVPLDSARETFSVQLVGIKEATSEVRLEGGEALKMIASEDRKRWRILHEPYVRVANEDHPHIRAESPGGTGAPFNPKSFLVTAYPPTEDELEQSVQKFPISIQNGDPTQFTPRPAEVWVEITPLLDETTPVSGAFQYPIFDRTLEESRPVPVLSCVAPKWPADAKFARIQLWFKLIHTPSLKPVKVEDVIDSDSIPGAPGVDYSIAVKPLSITANADAGAAVIVTQTFPDQVELWSVKVDMADSPDEIRREFFPEGRSVKHTFIYKHQGENELLGKRLKITTKSSLIDGAVTLPEPLTIKLLKH